jgi:hypothetical protein
MRIQVDSLSNLSHVMESLRSRLVKDLDARIIPIGRLLEICLLATFLDPRYRELSVLPQEMLDHLNSIILQEYENHREANPIQFHNPEDGDSTSCSSVETLGNTGNGNAPGVASEIVMYQSRTEISRDKDPLKWWRKPRSIKLYPVLRSMAQKYLGIPASSFISQKMFSQLMVPEMDRISGKSASARLFIAQSLNLFEVLRDEGMTQKRKRMRLSLPDGDIRPPGLSGVPGSLDE